MGAAFAALAVPAASAVADPGTSDHMCQPPAPTVTVDAAHSPAGEWSDHAHPFFAWSVDCNVIKFSVQTTWRGEFETDASTLHEDVPDGAHAVAVSAYYSYQTAKCRGFVWDPHGPDTPFRCTYTTHYAWTDYAVSPTVLVDTLAPDVALDLTGAFVEGADGVFVTSDTGFVLAASDAGSGVASVEHRFDDGAWTTYTGEFTAAGLDEGAHALEYRATDGVGHVTTAAVAFVLDDSAPVIEVLNPTPLSVTFDRVSAESCTEHPRVRDGETTVLEAKAPEVEDPGLPTLPDAPATPDAPDTPGVPVDPVSPPELVEDAARPCAGMLLETASFGTPVPMPGEVPPEVGGQAPGEVGVDAQSVTFTPPVVLTGVVTVRVDVQDALVGAAEVAFLVDGELREARAGGNGVYDFEWNTTAEAAGEHTLTVRATDLLGNAGDVTFAVLVLTQTPEGVEKTIAGVEEPEAPEAPELPEGTPEVPSAPA